VKEKELLHFIGDFSKETGDAVYIVGGYLRNEYLCIKTKDIDITVLGDGIKFAEKLAKKLKIRPPVVFEKFGTAMLTIGDYEVEIVTAREESYLHDSRKPIVKKSDLYADLSRRDFTINTLARKLNSKRIGKLIDLFGGMKDLKKGIIKTPLNPGTTFDDDPLRILRAARFASQLQFKIETETLKSLMDKKERLAIVSKERIRDEFMKILASDKPSTGLKLLKDTGILSIIFPEIDRLSGVEQRNKYHHKDVFNHTIRVVDNVAEKTKNLKLRFTALVHDIAKPDTKRFVKDIGWTFHGHDELGARMLKSIITRLKLPGEYLDYSQKLVRLHLRPINLSNEGVTDSAIRRIIVQAGKELDDLLTLCRADITSGNPRRVKQHLRNFDFVQKRIGEVKEKDKLEAFQSPVTGHEIMEACGIPPSKKVGEIKKAIEEAILDGIIPNEHDAAFEYFLQIKDKYLI